VKLYIAGPMSGYTDFNYPEFMWAADRLERLGYKTLNPCDNQAELTARMEAPTWNDYMRASIAQVIQADAVAVLEGWSLSRGARLEVEIAHALHMPVLPVQVWIRKAGLEKAGEPPSGNADVGL
jgi:hypothetical protein